MGGVAEQQLLPCLAVLHDQAGGADLVGLMLKLLPYLQKVCAAVEMA